MIVVTGGAGMIGSNIVAALNAEGRDDIIVVDDLTDGHKIVNLADLSIADYLDKDEFLPALEAGTLGAIDAVFHQGACSTTTEWNGKFMMEVNFSYSKRLLHACLGAKIPFLYASSASIYGGGSEFREEPQFEHPLNVYAWSKKLFDDYVRRNVLSKDGHSQVAGLRYFNVYGPRESFKKNTASMICQLGQKLLRGETPRLFKWGEQRRDFVYIEDVVQANLKALAPARSGVFNVGSGAARSYNELYEILSTQLGSKAEVEYIDNPWKFFQNHTEADLGPTREALGYEPRFSLEEGIAAYVPELLRLDGRELVA